MKRKYPNNSKDIIHRSKKSKYNRGGRPLLTKKAC